MARLVPTFFLLLLTLLASLSSAGKVTNPKNPPRNAILLSKVESLTFRSGRMTSNRRVPAVPQLSCVGPPSVCALYTIDTMRCTNEGSDYEKENIQWACRADLPEEFKLGSTDVACEGYESSDDPFVLKGSCGVEYRMLLTRKGEDRFGRVGEDDPWNGSEGSNSMLAKVIFFAIFGFVLFIIISGLLKACRRNPPRLGGNGGPGVPPWFGGSGGGGGGGGGDDVDNPPPPYDSHGFNQPPNKSRPNNTNTRTGSGSSSGNGQQQGWRPGPWTAGLAGAGLGYAFGRGQNRTQPRQPTRSGGFFGDGGGPSAPRPASPPTFSSSRHASTGFGGTSRR